MCTVDYRLDSTGCKGFSELCLYVYLHIYVCTNSQSFYRSNHLYVCTVDDRLDGTGCRKFSEQCVFVFMNSRLFACLYVYLHIYV